MAIVCSEIVKTYRGRKVVDNLSFTADRGEVVGLLGPNGAGKTTTFYTILGLVKPDAGEVLLDGQQITTMPIFRRSRLGLGYLAQEPSIFRKLSLLDNVRLYLEMAGVPRAERTRRAMELLKEFRIDARADSLGVSLSGGERRRAEIARALAASPAFLILDEPFTGVDPIAINEMQQIMRQLADRGIGVIITDHNVRETLSITDRAYIMSEGKVVTTGTADTIPHDPLARKYYLGENFRM